LQKILAVFKFKDLDQDLTLKDVDAEKGMVKGVLSKFGVIDSDGDMLMPGAYKKSIQERGPQSTSTRKIAYLRAHDTNAPVGKFTELYETSEGLEYVAKMSETHLGKDTLTLMKEGIMNNHSVGYMRIFDKEVDKGDYNEVREVKLMEGSVLMFGANAETPVTAAKGLSKESLLEKINSRMDRLIRVIRKGEFLDETYQLIEIELEQIKTLQLALLSEKPGKTTLENDEPLDLVQVFNSNFN